MKKLFTLILLSLLAVNLNLFATKEDKVQDGAATPEKQLSKKDMIKITAATLGCGLFTVTSIISYHSWRRIIANEMNPLDFVSGTMAIIPLFILEYSLKFLGIEDERDIRTPASFILGGIMSAGIAYKCGEYVSKKLAPNKENKSEKS